VLSVGVEDVRQLERRVAHPDVGVLKGVDQLALPNDCAAGSTS
jgi:hypothetical protein